MANARSFYNSSRSHSSPTHSSYYTGPVYRSGSTQEKSSSVKRSRVFTTLSIDVQWSASWTSKQVYSPRMKVGAITEDYSREEISSNED